MDTKNSPLAPGATLELPFRPLYPGAIQITGALAAPGQVIAKSTTPHFSELVLRVELIQPGGARVLDETVRLVGPRVTLSRAIDADQVGPWTARVTNASAVEASAELSAAYTTIPGNLGKIDHIVVLMMENRSFDHMLGYLRLGGRTEVDGLTGNESNSYGGQRYPVHALDTTAIAFDPRHEAPDVAEQLANHNGGFVANFAKVVPQAPAQLGLVMGYHPASHVPTYDFFAREFAICDRWYASLPSSTYPNRLYALAGATGGLNSTPGGIDLPIVTVRSIFELLRAHRVEWNVFYSDLPFALSLQHVVQDAYFTARMRPLRDFYDRARRGDLPPVTWIDPDFQNVHERKLANDDHAPGDIAYGQRFVAEIYRALAASPAWSRTLLVVIYDEHGGFYDHVEPPPAGADEPPPFDRYGVRVPAFVVSPWTARGAVAHDVYGHASILRTILARFCAADGKVPPMTPRVDHARDLGAMLSSPTLREIEATLPLPALPPAEPPSAPNPLGELLRRTAFGF